MDSSPTASSVEEHSSLRNELGDQVRHANNSDTTEQTHASQREPKRIRKSKSTQKTSHKKHVRGKQGCLEGIMMMPMEIFTEIVAHLTPSDLISLVRTNKFFRSVLLTRPATHIWQRAHRNVPGLPPCPAGMSEPQYASLMFSKTCTMCGGGTRSQPDPWLRVRLLRKEEDLGDVGELTSLVAQSDEIGSSKQRGRYIGTYYILEELDKVIKTRQEFVANHDYEGLDRSADELKERQKNQRKEGHVLKKYLLSQEAAREQEITNLKTERQRGVEVRLTALGWNQKYLKFSEIDQLQAWNSLVNVPKPLTDRVWKNLLPKLMPLLEENQRRIDEQAKFQRRVERHDKLCELIRQYRQDTHPYQEILKALDLPLPLADNIDDAKRGLLINPFPPIDSVLGWDFIASIHDGEHSLEQVDDLFKENQDNIDEKVREWREETESKLVDLYKKTSEDCEEINSMISIKGDYEVAESLSANTRFLLRADTVFISHNLPEWWREDGVWQPVTSCHFPSMIAENYPYAPNDGVEGYARHTEIEIIVKALLKDMDMPNATHAELNLGASRFTCGRCLDHLAMSWEELIDHYQSWLWLEQDYLPFKKYNTRHPVNFYGVHGLESNLNDKPLARMLLHGDHMAPPWWHTLVLGVWCLVCSGFELPSNCNFDTEEILQEHMRETHGIATSLAQELHYTRRFTTAFNQRKLKDIPKWEQLWDVFHDAQEHAT